LYATLVRFLSSRYDEFTRRRLSYCGNILERTQWMEKEELKKLQTGKLKALLRHAYENVPYYHRILRNSGFRPADFNRLEDMQRIPILKRSSLRLRPEELFAQNLRKSQIVACATSGTTAAPLRFYLTKAEMPWHAAAELRGYGWAGYRPGDKCVHIRRVRPGDVLTRPFERLRRLVLRCKLLNTLNLSEETLASFTLTLQQFKPDYVLGAAGSTNILATFLLQNNAHGIHPRGVFTYGQQLLPHYRKAIEEAFNCRVYDRYGSTEVPQIASQCGSHEGHHVVDENVLVEIAKDGEAAAPGEEGNVLITSLNGYATPFIRYDIGDTGRILKDECPCGRKLSLFSPIGRDYEYFVHSDGTFTFFRDLNTVFEDLPIKDFQIVQQTLDEILIKIVPRQGFKQAHADFILKSINWRIADIADVRVKLVDSLPLTGLGKVRHFTSKIHTKYT
jgi:phenylacetate-CoA ligase